MVHLTFRIGTNTTFSHCNDCIICISSFDEKNSAKPNLIDFGINEKQNQENKNKLVVKTFVKIHEHLGFFYVC